MFHKLGLYHSDFPPHNSKEIHELSRSIESLLNRGVTFNRSVTNAVRNGMRVTFSSVLIEPPPIQSLVEMASKGQIHSEVARALSKHANRDSFWGKISGNPKEVHNHAIKILEQIICEATWWNCYEHHKHRLVVEYRLSTGHGARWKYPSLEFIGFVEPF